MVNHQYHQLQVLILLGISFGVSGIPSEKFTPYHADVSISFGKKVRSAIKRDEYKGKFQKLD